MEARKWLQLVDFSYPSPVRLGWHVMVIGTNKDRDDTVTDGIISSWRRIEDSLLLQVTAPIWPGGAGAPVLNDDGRVIGVATSRVGDSQHMALVVPSENIRLHLKMVELNQRAAPNAEGVNDLPKAPFYIPFRKTPEEVSSLLGTPTKVTTIFGPTGAKRWIFERPDVEYQATFWKGSCVNCSIYFKAQTFTIEQFFSALEQSAGHHSWIMEWGLLTQSPDPPFEIRWFIRVKSDDGEISADLSQSHRELSLSTVEFVAANAKQ